MKLAIVVISAFTALSNFAHAKSQRIYRVNSVAQNFKKEKVTLTLPLELSDGTKEEMKVEGEILFSLKSQEGGFSDFEDWGDMISAVKAKACTLGTERPSAFLSTGLLTSFTSVGTLNMTPKVESVSLAYKEVDTRDFKVREQGHRIDCP